MNDTHLLDVTNLRRRYGGRGATAFEAVRDVSFSVRAGELFALLGTNGAGKTSTLEVIEGLARPTSGTVRLLGHDPFRERRRVRPHIGIMLQDSGFPSGLTVAEVARMWVGTLTSPRPVDEALELVGLRHRSGVRISQLSGGERRRLELAVTVLGRPRVLFLDEPTTGLDPESRRAAWRMLRDLLATGTTVVLTTHYLPEAEELADRLAILHEGRIVRAGTPAEVAAARPARISFDLPGPDASSRPPSPAVLPSTAWPPPLASLPLLADLPACTGMERPAAGTVELATTDLQRTLTALLARAASAGVPLARLNARSASLEEAFLAVADAATETQEVAA